jgi:CDP-diacylglycerol---glycerol-3-phosphate 3-phosphatidyltransferase
LLNVLAGAVLGYGAFVPGGFLVLVGGAFDMFDGAMARATNRKTVFGEFLDSTMDRFSEAAVFLGLAVAYLLHEPQGWVDVAGVVMCFLVMIGSIMISYTRAKAEGLDLDCEVGWLQRPERIIVVGVGLLLHAVSPFIPLAMLAALTVLTHFTVAQRVAHVRRLTASV